MQRRNLTNLVQLEGMTLIPEVSEKRTIEEIKEDEKDEFPF